MSVFRANSILPCSAVALRSFLGRPANLPLISQPDLELEILSAPEVIQTGELIRFQIMAFGFKQKAIHEYTEVDESRIVEILKEGAMRTWRHAQIMEVLSPTECRLVDEVEFEPPGGMLGYLLSEERIQSSLQEGMDFRYSALRELIEDGDIT